MHQAGNVWGGSLWANPSPTRAIPNAIQDFSAFGTPTWQHLSVNHCTTMQADKRRMVGAQWQSTHTGYPTQNLPIVTSAVGSACNFIAPPWSNYANLTRLGAMRVQAQKQLSKLIVFKKLQKNNANYSKLGTMNRHKASKGVDRCHTNLLDRSPTPLLQFSACAFADM